MDQGLSNYLGTIDLKNRKVVNNPDGSISTERSFSFSPDGSTEILIPQVVDGKVIDHKSAIDHFFKTGEHLGAFDTGTKGFSYDGLAKYAEGIHNTQADRYRK